MVAASPSPSPSPSPSAAPPATDSPSAAPPAITATATASPSASPPATAATASGRPHPSYTKMITQALTELGGTSGRAAIAGFILGRFTGLPAAHDHDALLSAHLRRLVAEGVVRGYGSKSRACYVFPASDTRGRGRPRNAATRLPKNLNLDHGDDDETIWPAPFPLATCVNPDWDPKQNWDPNLDLDLDLDGFQSKTSGDGGEHDDDDEYTPRPVPAAKRGRGRPPKIKRGRGRPSKEKPDSASAGIKRGRGRPSKEKPDSASAGIKRGRGRPRKYNPAAAVSAEDGDAVSTGMA